MRAWWRWTIAPPLRTDSTFQITPMKLALIRLGAAEGDARLLKPHQVQRTLARAGVGEGELDLLVAGSPCQGFSHMQTQAFEGRGPTTQEQRWSSGTTLRSTATWRS